MKKKLMIFCIALGLSLTLAAPSFAAVTINLDPASLTDGLYTAGSPGIISTAYGNVEFVGEIKDRSDLDLPAGKVFNVQRILDPDPRNASLTFKFSGPTVKVTDVTFQYGGNADAITVQAWDIDDNLLDELVDAPTGNSGSPHFASIGPVTLEAGDGNSIYRLSWFDPVNGGPSDYDLAELQGVSISVIPAPGAILLGSIGVGFVGWLRRRRTL